MKKGLLLGCLAVAAASACAGEGTFRDWGVHERRYLHAKQPLAAADGRWEFQVAVPTGVERKRLVLAAENRLVIGAGTTIASQAGKELATVSGLQEVSIGRTARVGSVYGGLAKPVSVDEGSSVQGFVKASHRIEAAETATVAIGKVENVSDPGEYYRWRVSPPPTFGDRPVARGFDARTLAPGAYTSVALNAGDHLVLGAGHYFLQRLELLGGTLEIDDATGPVYLWVSDFLAIHTGVRCSARSRFLLAYHGSGSLAVAAGFCGMLVAPRATIELNDTLATYTGSFFASSIEVGPGVSIEHRPFALW